jgi:SRSO17 transposase
MVTGAAAAGVPSGWVAADEAYGRSYVFLPTDIDTITSLVK